MKLFITFYIQIALLNAITAKPLTALKYNISARKVEFEDKTMYISELIKKFSNKNIKSMYYHIIDNKLVSQTDFVHKYMPKTGNCSLHSDEVLYYNETHASLFELSYCTGRCASTSEADVLSGKVSATCKQCYPEVAADVSIPMNIINSNKIIYQTKKDVSKCSCKTYKCKPIDQLKRFRLGVSIWKWWKFNASCYSVFRCKRMVF